MSVMFIPSYCSPFACGIFVIGVVGLFMYVRYGDTVLGLLVIPLNIMRLTKEKLIGSGCASSPDNRIDDDLSACGKCQFCKLHIDPSTSFKSTVTNDSFSLSKHAVTTACKTKNVVYLITCAKCNIQYVGMTTQAICSRFDGHRTKIRNKKISTALCQHFSKEDHSVADMKVQIGVSRYDLNKKGIGILKLTSMKLVNMEK